MALYVVRHAKAGSRTHSEGPDDERPLSKTGRAQATRLARRLADHPITRILSSPYVRCTQTVEPLAERLQLKVESVDELAEGAPGAPAMELLAKLPDESVLCTHGDILEATLALLVEAGMVIVGRPDYRKGATWVIERRDGQWLRAKAWPPA